MKLGVKTFLLISLLSLTIVILSVKVMMQFQSVKIEKQIDIVTSSLKTFSENHPVLLQFHPDVVSDSLPPGHLSQL